MATFIYHLGAWTFAVGIAAAGFAIERLIEKGVKK